MGLMSQTEDATSKSKISHKVAKFLGYKYDFDGTIFTTYIFFLERREWKNEAQLDLTEFAKSALNL